MDTIGWTFPVHSLGLNDNVQVGNTYYTVSGDQYTIIAEINPNVFVDVDGNEWNEDGIFYSCYEEGNPYYDFIGKVE